MKTTKKNKDFAEMVDILSNMSKKDWRDIQRIVRQYRKAHRMLDRAIERKDREFMLPAKNGNNKPVMAGVDYAYQ